MLKSSLALCILLLLSGTIHAQQAKKPEKIYIVNDSIVDMPYLDSLLKDGSIKGMSTGLSDEEQERLSRIHGDKIGNNFVMVVTVKTPAEKAAEASAPPEERAPAEDPVPTSYKLNINDAAADFNLEMLDGSNVKLSELKGQVVLLNFWATWCAPCMMEFHELPDAILKRFENEKLVFLPVSRGETREVVAKKMDQLSKLGINFNVGLDPDKKIWDSYATEYIPKNYLIDKKGVIRYVSTGYTDESLARLAGEIEKLLQEQ